MKPSCITLPQRAAAGRRARWSRLPGMARRWVAGASLAGLTGLAATVAADDGPRDPMQLPAGARPAAVAADGSAVAAPTPRHLMVVGGTRYVVDKGRRRQVGDLLDGARIERIDDGVVLVRQAGALLRLPLYGDVLKRPLADGGAATVTAGLPRPARPSMATPELPRPQRPQRPGEQP